MNEIATDVSFEFSSPDGRTNVVRAHKAILIATSPVFEAMFAGDMAEARPDYGAVKIEDIDVVTFKEMLRYIYCKRADVTADNASHLMYAAKKYLTTGLIAKCRKVLKKEINANTVFTVLEQSILFDENALKEKCLKFIGRNARCVFNAEGFLQLSSVAVEEIVGMNALAFINERQMYEHCVKWARYRLQQSGNVSPSDVQIREELGNILYKIRFLTMTQQEFAELTSGSAVLTAEERVGIYDYMATGKMPENLRFMAQIRRRLEEKVNRLSILTNGPRFVCDEMEYRLSFRSTENILLVGVGFYGGTEEGSTHDVTLTVSGNDNETLSRVETVMTSDGSENPIEVYLEQSVYVCMNVWYNLSFCLKGPETWSGKATRSTHDIGVSGRISFSVPPVSLVNLCSQQLPQLIFMSTDGDTES